MTSAPPANGENTDQHYREQLRALREPGDDPPSDRLRQILCLGADRYGVALGLLVRTDRTGDTYTIDEVSAPHPDLTRGLTGDLLSTYCRMVVAEQAPLAIENALKQGWADDPAYQSSLLSTYLGTAVHVRNEVYGTVCFVDPEPREAPFDEADRSFLELIGRAVEEVLEQRTATDTDDESDAGQSLSGVERRYRTALKHSPILFAKVDRDLRYEWICNPHEDFDPASVIGKRDDELNAGPGIDQLVDLKRRTLERGEQLREEIVFERSDGLHVYDVTATPLREGKGDDVTGLITASLDITDRREQERRLEESETRYRALAENFPDGAVGVYDNDLRYTLVRGTLVGDTLPSEDEFEGSQVWDLFPEQTTSDIVPLFRRAVEKGELGSVETQFGGRDWKVWATPLRDRDGTIFAGLSFAQDVTEQKERERTLRRHRNLLDQTQRLAGAWEVDLRTDEVTWSEALYEIHEVPPGTTIDLDDALGYFPEEARAELRDAFRRCVDEHEPYDLELPLRTAEGNERWVRTVGAPAAVEDGTVVKVAGAFQNITERKEEERKRKQVIRRVTDAIVEVDADWRFTLVNDQAEALYDRTEEELLGKHFWDVFEEALGTRFEDTYRRVMETREPASFVEYYSGLNGWFDITAYPNDDGGLAFYFQEVTERKQQEARLRDLSNSVPGVVFQFFVRPDGTYGFHFVSEHAEDTLGIAPDPNTFYERCLERIPDSHQEAFRTSIEEAVEEKAPWESEVPFVKPSGERRWILGRSIPREQDGEVVFNGVLLDITDRKDAERALERNKERLSMALEGGNIGTWDWDLDTGEVIFNRQWAEMLGYSRDELDFHFSTWEDLVHPEDLPRAMEALNEYIEGERATYAPEIRMRTKGGDWKWIQTIGKVIDRDEDGEIARAAGIHLDIDEQKHYEEQLRTAKREAEEAARLKSVMLANMSHEVRTPLTSMIGFSGLLASRLDGKAAKLARLIRKSGQRLEETMEAVLQLSQLEAGGYTLDRDSLSLDSLVRRIVDEFELQADEAGVTIHVETPDTPVEAYVDDTAVRRVLSNLLDNALKFTPEGGEVWVRTYADGAETVVDIEDTGVGIAEEALSDVFKAFKQESEGLTREYEGAGLGLSIVRELVDALGGTITLDSEKGEGTCVTVRLPRTKGSASHTQSVR